MFGRRKSGSSDEAIAEFWRWWTDARHRVAKAIEDGSVGSMEGEISGRVAAIHKSLQWELSKGKAAAHSLVVTPAGEASLRATVARWLAAAPAANETFEYFGSRQADDAVFTARMQIGGRELDLSSIRFSFTVEDDAHEIDVTVFHSDFEALPQSAMIQVTFLSLDWALGEEQVELWIGQVDPSLDATADLRSVADLQAAVRDLAAKHAEPRYAMIAAETSRGVPMMALVQVPLKPARWPRFDTHVAVTLSYPAQDNGLPTDESLTQLRDIEDRIVPALGADGDLVAHETSDGKRTLHIYVDGATGAATAVESGGDPPLKVSTKVTYDPAFEGVAHLRV